MSQSQHDFLLTPVAAELLQSLFSATVLRVGDGVIVVAAVDVGMQSMTCFLWAP